MELRLESSSTTVENDPEGPDAKTDEHRTAELGRGMVVEAKAKSWR